MMMNDEQIGDKVSMASNEQVMMMKEGRLMFVMTYQSD